jgi:plasmid stabilization system protein ParE
MRDEWSADALADLDRFSDFLKQHYPSLAGIVGREVILKTRVLGLRPELGHRIGGHDDYRQIVLRVLNAPYVIQYRRDGERIVILRVFHGREAR